MFVKVMQVNLVLFHVDVYSRSWSLRIFYYWDSLEKEIRKIEKDFGRPANDTSKLSEWADKERISTINKVWKLSMERKFTLALVGKHAG